MKKISKITIALGTIAFFVFLLLAGIKYKISYAKTEIETLFFNDGRYQLVIYEIGEPDWPFGSTHCRFVLYDNTKQINTLNFSIRNDGAPAQGENFHTYWGTDNVMTRVSGEEQEDNFYSLYFDGSTDIK